MATITVAECRNSLKLAVSAIALQVQRSRRPVARFVTRLLQR